jgi:hypothetical protein
LTEVKRTKGPAAILADKMNVLAVIRAGSRRSVARPAEGVTP